MMKSLARVLIAAAVPCALLPLLAGCSNSPAVADAFFDGNASISVMQTDTFASVNNINKALRDGVSLETILAHQARYVKPSLKSEVYSLTAGSCGSTGAKAYRFAMSVPNYIYVYQSRTAVFAGGHSDKATVGELSNRACGALGE